ncbi:MAG TPA: SgcJ/EcaC family oxidoreductase [Vicinamibacterales bacterium]|jgi:uncharacterized protein (TIGR02246 family)|nr:SgcJ/EcaC family oxidoreductase [Vicinamibacterales bacterium]
MRCLICLFCLTIGSMVSAQSPAANASDEAAVRDIVRRYTEARELSDPKAIEALFTADADQYTTSGEWRRGMSQMVKGMLETSARNPGARVITIAAVRFLTPDVAIVDGEYKTGTDARLVWTTLTVKRDGRVWKIAAIRNIAPTAPTR